MRANVDFNENRPGRLIRVLSSIVLEVRDLFGVVDHQEDFEKGSYLAEVRKSAGVYRETIKTLPLLVIESNMWILRSNLIQYSVLC